MFDVTKEADEVLIALQQKDLKSHRKYGQGENLSIGFSVFKVPFPYLIDLIYNCILLDKPGVNNSKTFEGCDELITEEMGRGRQSKVSLFVGKTGSFHHTLAFSSVKEFGFI